jgi:hypothetical protein
MSKPWTKIRIAKYAAIGIFGLPVLGAFLPKNSAAIAVVPTITAPAEPVLNDISVTAIAAGKELLLNHEDGDISRADWTPGEWHVIVTRKALASSGSPSKLGGYAGYLCDRFKSVNAVASDTVVRVTTEQGGPVGGMRCSDYTPVK